jgi:hypothetical protein
MTKNLLATLMVVGLLATTSGCSVGMAMSGKKAPDLTVVKTDANRQDIELQLGPPVQTSSNDLGGVTAIYDYEVGNEPSAGRAIGHGLADVLTLGAWELVGTPVEAVQGDKYRLTIVYDKDNKAKTISSQKI